MTRHELFLLSYDIYPSILRDVSIREVENYILPDSSKEDALNKAASRRSMLKWTGALAAVGVVGVGLGIGGDMLLRPSTTKTTTMVQPETQTATQTLTESSTATEVSTATQVSTATATETATATATLNQTST